MLNKGYHNVKFEHNRPPVYVHHGSLKDWGELVNPLNNP